MPIEYRPTVNDESGQILAQGIAGAAKINADGRIQSAENLSRGIASAADSVGGAIGQAGKIYAQNKAKLSSSYGKIEAFGNIGFIAPEEADALSKIKDPDKLAGSLAVIEQQFQQDQMRKRQQASQVNAANIDLMVDEEKRKRSRVGQTFVAQDPLTGKKFSFIYGSDGQVELLPQDQTAGPADPVPQYDQSGNVIGHIVTTNGRQQFVKAATPGGGSVLGIDPQAMKAQQVDQLKSEIAELQKKVDGGDNYRGPDWIPIFGSYNKELEAKKARLAGLLGGEQGAADAAGATSPAAGGGQSAGGRGSPGGKFQSAADVKAAVKAGQLSREQAVDILRTQFGL